MLKFEERKEKFEKAFDELMKKHSVAIYAANVVLKNGEVAPMIKIADLVEQKDADKTKQ